MQKRTRQPTYREPSRVEATTDKVDAAPSKYRNKKTEVDGIVFDSKKEAKRYQELKMLERTGDIKDLTLQVRIPLEVEGERVCVYVCDFRYYGRKNGGWYPVYEDVKGKRTPVYLLKKKLVKAILGVDILET